MSILSTLEKEYLAAANAGDPATDALAGRVDAAATEKEARLTAPGALLNSALWYASQGLAVFPCKPGEKRPATLNGFHDATTDPGKIREWWGRMPAANVGLPTGFQFDVVDVDGPEGYQSLTGLRDDLPPLIGRATTPRGVHLYIRATGDGNSTNLLPGIDFRGEGGYVLAPPSSVTASATVKTTGTYRWTQPLTQPPLRREP